VSTCSKIKQFHRAGPVAQWLEQRTHNPLVGGSSPSGPTRIYCLFSRGESSTCAAQPNHDDSVSSINLCINWAAGMARRRATPLPAHSERNSGSPRFADAFRKSLVNRFCIGNGNVSARRPAMLRVKRYLQFLLERGMPQQSRPNLQHSLPRPPMRVWTVLHPTAQEGSAVQLLEFRSSIRLIPFLF
jgi:hypothetical protein